MKSNKPLQILVALLAVYIGLGPAAFAQQSKDLVPPVIKHKPLSESLPLGEPLSISATVTDDVGVGQVMLFYRTQGRNAYQRVAMRRLGTTSIYMVSLRGVRKPGLEYYIQATDLTGNILLEGYDFAPLFVAVVDPGAAPVVPETPQAPAAAAAETAPATTTTATAAKTKGSGATKWLWIGLGVVAVGALASGGGGGGGGDTGSVNVGAPAPQ